MDGQVPSQPIARMTSMLDHVTQNGWLRKVRDFNSLELVDCIDGVASRVRSQHAGADIADAVRARIQTDNARRYPSGSEMQEGVRFKEPS